MKLKPNEKMEVSDVVRSFFSAYERRSLADIRSAVSDNENHVSWGTGKDETYVGRSHFLGFLERDFAQSEGAKFDVVSEYITVHDGFAWMATEVVPTVTIAGKPQRFETMRATIVLAKSNGRWVIEHSHASWPYGAQPVGSSFPLI